MPHQHLIHMCLFVFCCKSRYFEEIVEFGIFRLRMIYNFFQVWQCDGWDLFIHIPYKTSITTRKLTTLDNTLLKICHISYLETMLRQQKGLFTN